MIMILNSPFRLDFSQTTSCAITNFFGPSTTHNQKPAAAAAKTPLLSQKDFTYNIINSIQKLIST
jgi:hypothetical protein